VAIDGKSRVSAFAWNGGGWFGAQFGSTLWLLILGIVLLRKDSLPAWLCLARFLVFERVGLVSLAKPERLSAYAGCSAFSSWRPLVIAVVVVVVNTCGLSRATDSGSVGVNVGAVLGDCRCSRADVAVLPPGVQSEAGSHMTWPSRTGTVK
jgi:hypothetical protein